MAWDDCTPAEPARTTDQAQSLAKLCGQDVANKLGMRELPPNAQAAVQEWVLAAMRQAAQAEASARCVAESKLREVTRDLIQARNRERTAE